MPDDLADLADALERARRDDRQSNRDRAVALERLLADLPSIRAEVLEFRRVGQRVGRSIFAAVGCIASAAVGSVLAQVVPDLALQITGVIALSVITLLRWQRHRWPVLPPARTLRR